MVGLAANINFRMAKFVHLEPVFALWSFCKIKFRLLQNRKIQKSFIRILTDKLIWKSTFPTNLHT